MTTNRRETIRAFTHPATPIYVGATTNRNNVGDDLLLVAHEHLLSTPLAVLPMGGNDRLLRLRLLRSRELPLVLGGGTLIGRPAYRRALESAIARAGSGVAHSMLGVGVSAPDETGKSSLEELEAWAPVLGSFPRVRVRGPRSAEHLRRVGIETTVVGDPVLALMRPLRRARSTGDPPRVVLNAADVPDMDAATPVIADAVAAVAREHPDLEIVVVSAADYDDEAAERLARSVRSHGLAAEVVRLSGASPAETAHALRGSVAVPVRLHIGVCAVALDIPAVALGYEDKCDDFLDSVDHPAADRDAPGAVEADWLASRIAEAIDARGIPPTSLAVDRLVDTQIAAGRAVRRELGLEAG